MNRGIVIIKDGMHEEILYLSCSAFVGGAMDSAIEYLDENHGNKLGVKELAFDLLKVVPELEIYCMSENSCLDIVYTFQIHDGLCPNDFVYQKVLTNCRFDELSSTALSEEKSYRVDMEKMHLEADAYWEHQRKLQDSILPCPHCGRKGWRNITPNGERVRCFIDTCPGNAVGKWHRKFEDAIDEWNRYVMQK